MENSQYNASNIRVLKGLEPVRLRPGMYIGSTSERGLHHLVYEVVDNSVDEALAGRCDYIKITIDKDNIVTVEDDGSGIPIEKHPETGKSTLETVLTVLHAGGKFDDKAYKVSGGLHGVGVSVVNALSEYLIAEVKREGHIFRMTFERGKATSDLEIIGDTKETGTKISFKADGEIFDTTVYDNKTLADRFREMAFLNKSVRLIFEDRREDKTVEFKYDGGIKEFVEYLNRNKTPIFEEIPYFEGMQESTEVEIAFQYTDGYSENILSFANNIYTVEGGTHLSGFRSALTRSINDYARKYKLLKENEDNLQGEDAREGITAIISVKITEPQFEGQTKGKLGNGEVRGAVDAFFSEHMGNFLEENPKIAKQIIQKALASRRAREAARKARDLTRKRSILDSTTLPGKLADCQSTDLGENEIFIVEGNSAGGSAKGGRDNRIQAILPLRGKIMNVEKANLDRILNYEEIKSMITAFGTGIGKEFDLSKLRYGKIIIMTDADVDGAHIRTLLLTFFYRYMKPLIDEGHVFIAQPPLYKVSSGKNERYCYTDKELEEIVKSWNTDNYKIQRYKGLGEMNADQLWETTMDPEHRVLLQVYEKEDSQMSTDATFSMLMGEKVEPRREFIEENAQYVENLDV
ncbi:DNA topoisomerase (ATP-hydrolyzing) subunit B [Anaerococcus porci]|uniref:DNA gyrase subunit B n=1 Tax=Anaerococcus porci TaxID=2652269 RepID=A0A6N7VU65_9FIRM|nr:DNA topoisomerase (ATP-hydrolyzing) subunit B [Anaerococcus porci]MDY3005853.1 DNA topoisomerase (ATP-hydrolyzing) subunit B [Anaerococcus porci]MSS77594.1 DNA topoisomerase (ATP-hydrolyzing) subunit B [Anaerococcus porci]